MPKNDIEAFEYVGADEDTPREIDFITYAIFAYRKQQWIEHFKSENNSQMPSQQQIDDWISQLSPYDFNSMRSDAADFFEYSAKQYLQGYVDEQRNKAVDESILHEVRVYTNPWKDVGIALIFAILAPIILGTAIFLISIFDNSFQIHISVGGHAPPHAAEQPAK